MYSYFFSPGKGQPQSNGGSGGSHGGRGGRGYGYMQALQPYGTIFEESTWGSGGGSRNIGDGTGGRGGGYIHMYATETIQISGTVRADGKASTVKLPAFLQYSLPFTGPARII